MMVYRTNIFLLLPAMFLVAFATPNRGAAQPVAKVLEVSGKPKVVAVDGAEREAAVFGSIYQGEKLDLPPMSMVVLGFRKTGKLERIRSEEQPTRGTVTDLSVTVDVNGVKESLAVKRQRLVSDAIEELSDLPTAGVTILRGTPSTEPRHAITPIPDASILDPRPRFSWPEIPGATSYSVTLLIRRDRLWSVSSKSSTLDFPADADSLEPGKQYRVEIVTEGSEVSLNRFESEFTLAYPEDVEGTETWTTSQQPALIALAAIRFEQLELISKAIEQYEKLVQLAPEHATFHAALADLYQRAGRSSDAAEAKQTAAKLGFEFQAERSPENEGASIRPDHEMFQLAGKAMSDFQQGTPVDPKVIAEILCWSCRLPESSAAIRRDAQLLATRVLWDTPTIAAQKEMAESDADLEHVIENLQRVIRRSERKLVVSGVPRAVAKLGQLNIATFQYNWQLLQACERTLDAIGPTVIDEQVFAGTQARYWNLRGLLASESGQFALAFEHHAKALALRRSAAMPIDEAESLNNLGKLFLELGDFASAKKQLESALAIYQRFQVNQLNPQLAVAAAFARINLSKAMEAGRDFDASAKILRSVTEQRSAVDEKGLVDTICHNNLGLLLYQQGDFEESHQQLSVARELAARLFGENHIRTIESDVNLAWLDFSQGNFDATIDRFQRSLNTLQRVDPDHHRIAEINSYLARVLSLTGDSQQAKQRLLTAVEQRQQQMQHTLGSALSERDRLAYVQKLRVHSESIGWPGALDTMLELAPTLNIGTDEQYDYVRMWKGILQQTSTGGEKETASIDGSNLRAKWLSLRKRLRLQLGQGLIPNADLERQVNELERRLRRQNSAADSFVAPTLDDLADALPQNSLLLDVIETRLYRPREAGQSVRDNRRYVGFLVNSAGQVQRIEFGNAAEVDASIEAFIDRITSRRSFSTQARRLGRMLIDPIVDRIEGAEQLIISADGLVHRVPWAALPGVESKFLVEELALTSVTSSRSIVHSTDQPTSRFNSWLAVGGVDYGTASPRAASSPTWQSLKSSGSEAEFVDQLFRERFPGTSEGTLLVGTEASKNNILSRMEERKFIHFATHGSFVDRQADAFEIHGMAAQLDSFLVFAGANETDPPAAAYLSAEEIGELDLRNTEVVTMSACETALGHIQAGQGLIGLVAALDRAGAGCIISALWKVDDEATSQFMRTLYANMLKQKSLAPQLAVREAQLELIHDSGGQYDHPFYWAAWTTHGVTGPSELI